MATKFAGKKNIWTGDPLKPARKIDPTSLSIADDPVITQRSSPVSKYEDVFRKLLPGQCLICEPDQAGKLNTALQKWLRANGMEPVKTKAMTRYPTDGKGRVWRLS